MAGLLCNDTLAARFEDPEKANWKDAGDAFCEGALEPRRESTALGRVRVTAEALRRGTVAPRRTTAGVLCTSGSAL